MSLTFDPKYNIAYIQLRPKRGKVRTVQVSEELNVDLAADGSVYGIELLNANEQLARGKALIVENRATKTRRSMKLAG
ncbi:MAG: DUF2283 domain-containing protein [Tepidisphaeraceae bacterium]